MAAAAADFSSPQAQAFLARLYADPTKMQVTDGCAPGTGYAETFALTERQTCADCFDPVAWVTTPPCVPQKVFIEHPVYAQNGTPATQRMSADGEWYIVYDPRGGFGGSLYTVYPVLTSGWGMAFLQLALPILTAGFAAIGELAMAGTEVASSAGTSTTTTTVSEGASNMGEGFGLDISTGDFTDFFGDFSNSFGDVTSSMGDVFDTAGSFGDFGSGIIDPSIISDATAGWNIPGLETGAWVPNVTSGLPGMDTGGVFNETGYTGSNPGGIGAGGWSMPSLEDVLATAVKGYQVWQQANKPPVQSGASRTTATGTTVPNKNGTVTTIGTGGRTTTVRMPIGQPYAFPDGTVVINNGDGTYSVISTTGQAQTLTYPSGTGTGGGLLGSLGEDKTLLIVGGVGLALLAFSR